MDHFWSAVACCRFLRWRLRRASLLAPQFGGTIVTFQVSNVETTAASRRSPKCPVSNERDVVHVQVKGRGPRSEQALHAVALDS